MKGFLFSPKNNKHKRKKEAYRFTQIKLCQHRFDWIVDAASWVSYGCAGNPASFAALNIMVRCGGGC